MHFSAQHPGKPVLSILSILTLFPYASLFQWHSQTRLKSLFLNLYFLRILVCKFRDHFSKDSHMWHFQVPILAPKLDLQLSLFVSSDSSDWTDCVSHLEVMGLMSMFLASCLLNDVFCNSQCCIPSLDQKELFLISKTISLSFYLTLNLFEGYDVLRSDLVHCPCLSGYRPEHDKMLGKRLLVQMFRLPQFW